MSEKQFDERNISKKDIHNERTKKSLIINTKEIWYVTLGCNIGYEQDGKKNFLRPVLVVRRIGSLYFCIPLTTKGKIDSKYYHKLESTDFDVDSLLILSQGRVLDKKRFRYQIGKVSAEEFYHIKKLLKDMYLGEVS